jgi:polysaccharide chain length determinant protein (PEP-CTERM system associated)
MLPGKKLTAQEVVRILLRHRWMVLVPLALGLAAIPLVAKHVPVRYRSQTMIMVVPQRVPDSYVRSTITATVVDRLPSLSEQILSRSHLERIIRDLDLYKEARATGIMEDIVQRMRRDITVPPLAAGAESFRVSYVSDSPQAAQKVTERLASLYIEQNLLDRENQAENTNRFLETELENSRLRLMQYEKKLEDYKRRYAGQLPSQLPGNLQAIANLRAQLQSVSDTINRAQERRLLLERQLAEAQALPEVTSQTAALQPVTRLQTTVQQLEAATADLKSARLRLRPGHPDVRALERVIRDLEVRHKEEQAVAPPAPPEKTLTPADRERQDRLGYLRAELGVIDLQLAANNEELARLKESIADYQSRIDAVPARESELVELTRDYATLQAAYAQLSSKREDSKIAANLERRQIGEQFRIVDPASLPERPDNEFQRLVMIAACPVSGLLFGLLIVCIVELRDTSLKREEDIAHVLSLPVLALVPAMASESERKTQRRRTLLTELAVMTLLVGAVGVAAIWGLRP